MSSMKERTRAASSTSLHGSRKQPARAKAAQANSKPRPQIENRNAMPQNVHAVLRKHPFPKLPKVSKKERELAIARYEALVEKVRALNLPAFDAVDAIREDRSKWYNK